MTFYCTCANEIKETTAVLEHFLIHAMFVVVQVFRDCVVQTNPGII